MAYDQGFTDGQITPAQMTMGTLFVWVLILFHKKSWVNPFKGPWIKLGLIGIFGLSLTTVFYNIALKELNASLSHYSSVSIYMDDDCNGLYRETKASKKGMESIAIVFILVGTLLAVNVFETNWEQFSLLGILYGLLSALTYSIFLYFLLDKWLVHCLLS